MKAKCQMYELDQRSPFYLLLQKNKSSRRVCLPRNWAGWIWWRNGL